MGRARRLPRAPGQPLLSTDGRGRLAHAAPRQRPPQDGEARECPAFGRGRGRGPREWGSGTNHGDQESISPAPEVRRQRAVLPFRPSPAARGSAMNQRRQPERMLYRCFSKQSFPVRNKPSWGTWEEENPATISSLGQSITHQSAKAETGKVESPSYQSHPDRGSTGEFHPQPSMQTHWATGARLKLEQIRKSPH